MNPKEPDNKTPRHLRKGVWLLLIVMLVKSAIGLAILYKANGGSMPEFLGALRQRGLTVLKETKTLEKDTIDLPIIDARISHEIRTRITRKNEILEGIKENEVHYRLLRQRTFSADSPEIVALIQDQIRLEQSLEAVIEDVERLESFRRRLIQSQVESPGEVGGIDKNLLVEIRRHLTRANIEPQWVIPESPARNPFDTIPIKEQQ